MGGAVLLVIPFYAAAAWCVARFWGTDPMLDPVHRFVVYAILCAGALGAAVASFHVRRAVARKQAERGIKGHHFALCTGLAMAETPALVGLVYFIFYRDWIGFWLLLVASLAAFMLHGMQRRPEPA
jgi:hypothetical protein